MPRICILSHARLNFFLLFFPILLVRKLRNFSLQPKHTQHTSAVRLPCCDTSRAYASPNDFIRRSLYIDEQCIQCILFIFSISMRWKLAIYLFLIWICNLLAVKLNFRIAECLFVLIGWAPQCKAFWVNLGRFVHIYGNSAFHEKQFYFAGKILNSISKWSALLFELHQSILDCVFSGIFFLQDIHSS